LLIARFVRKKFFFSYDSITGQAWHESTFEYYQKYRRPVLGLFLALFIIIAVTNVVFGIYQRGTIPRTILPFGLSGIYAWLLLFGLASISAVILDCEFRSEKNPYVVSILSILECFFSSVSMLSRGMVLNGGSLIIGMIDNAKRRFIVPSPGFFLIVVVVFGSLFVFSIFPVNYIRSYVIVSSTAKAEARLPQELKSKEFKSAKSLTRQGNVPEPAPMSHDQAALNSRALRLMVKTTKQLMFDRWVGMEGIMAVSSYPGLGWNLWNRVWRERYSHSGTSMYDLTFIESPYLQVDMTEHHFVSLPGILAFFYYPGSYPFLFMSMLLLGFLGAGIELFVYRLSGGNIILCSLMAQVVAYRYAHFGYAPNQAYLLFGSLFLNVLIIYLLDRSLALLDRKHRKVEA